MGNNKTNKTISTKEKKSKDFGWLWKSLYMIAFASQLAIAAYLLIQVSSPDSTQQALGVFGIIGSVYCFVRVITIK